MTSSSTVPPEQAPALIAPEVAVPVSDAQTHPGFSFLKGIVGDKYVDVDNPKDAADLGVLSSVALSSRLASVSWCVQRYTI